MAEKKELSPSGVLRFGVFQANLAARELRKHGVRIRLPGQPFCILSMLLEKPGEIATREEMRQRLWPSDTFVDFEHSLNSAVKKLRAALGDSPENSRYIETVPRVGYRFVAPVEVVPVVQPADMSLATDRSAPPDVGMGNGGRRWQVYFGIPLVLMAVTAGGYFAWSRFRSRPQPQSNIGGEIRVDPKGKEASEFNNQPALSSKSAEARDLYLKGMYFWNKRNVGGFQQAIECFQQATKIDPNYALAYAGLANSYTLLSAYSVASPTLYIPQARTAALKSLQLNENLAEAHTALALIVQNHDWDWQTSEKEYRRAIELNPDYATAHQWYAEHLMWLGRFDEALRESEKARQLDPLSLIIETDHGAILYYSRQYVPAVEQLHTVLVKAPNFERAVNLTASSYAQSGLFIRALAEAEVLRHLYGDGPAYWVARAQIYGRMGQQEQSRAELEKLEKLNRHEQQNPWTMLVAHLAVGDKEEALTDLEKAYSGHYNLLTSLKVEPVFDPLRSDPRFQDLLRRVGLAGQSGSDPLPGAGFS